MKKKKPQTNLEFVSQLMRFSQFGALAQVFVIQALEQYAQAIVSTDPKEFDNQLIPAEVWQGVAQEVLDKLKARSL